MRSRFEREKRGLYRARDGKIFGVCKGIANYLDVSVGWTRVLVVVTALFTSVWPAILVYVLAALLIKPEPILPLQSDDDREFYNSYVSSRPMALHRLKQTFDRLDRRIRRMEDIVTARDYDWERRLNQ